MNRRGFFATLAALATGGIPKAKAMPQFETGPVVIPIRYEELFKYCSGDLDFLGGLDGQIIRIRHPEIIGQTSFGDS
jgi:hypothetical protein